MKPKSVKLWEHLISDYVDRHGPVVPGSGVIQFHHVAGRTYKHNKVLIGPYFILPIPWELHDVHSNSDVNVSHWPRKFTSKYGSQRDLWEDMVTAIVNDAFKLPFPDDVWDTIMDTRF